MTKRPQVNQGSSSIPPISLSFLLKTIGGALERHPIHRGNHVNVSIKTCITSLVAKRSSQLSRTMVFLNLSKSITNEEASMLFQAFKWNTKAFLCN